MARYQHLPIYKDTYDVTLGLLQSIRSFPRLFKYTLGSEIQKNLYTLLAMIVKVNGLYQKKDLLTNVSVQVELIQTQIRLARDCQCFKNIQSAIDFSNRLVKISRQVEGWRRSV
jgi:hypothetical protein